MCISYAKLRSIWVMKSNPNLNISSGLYTNESISASGFKAFWNLYTNSLYCASTCYLLVSVSVSISFLSTDIIVCNLYCCYYSFDSFDRTLSTSLSASIVCSTCGSCSLNDSYKALSCSSLYNFLNFRILFSLKSGLIMSWSPWFNKSSFYYCSSLISSLLWFGIKF